MDDAKNPTAYGVRDEADLLEVITEAVANKTRLDIRGHGSRTGLGHPVDAERVVSLAGLSGMTTYEPDELVMIAKPATPLKDVLRALDDAGQMLAFDPPLGGVSHDVALGTIGGIFATNASGPRRMVAGAARDYLLGFRAVSGRGEIFKSGSRVMKNVTGYDLSKLMAGSFGTLAVMDEVTFKTMPKPEDSATILVRADDEMSASGIVREAFDSPHEPAAAAIIPSRVAIFSSCKTVKDFGQSGVIVALRLEGFRVSVKSRVKALRDLLMPLGGGEMMVLSKRDSDKLQGDLREVRLLPENSNRVIWKLSCPVASGGEIMKDLGGRANCRVYGDWGGGLIWLSYPLGIDGGVGVLRRLLVSFGGQATLVSAPQELRERVDVFEPLPSALFELSRRVKASFDPLGILNPGRVYRGI